MSEKLKELLVKVEAAEGADREIDALIYLALEYPDWRLQVSCDLFPEQVQVGRIQEPEGTRSVHQGFGWRESPKFTASIDAAVALVEKKLPGWERTIAFVGGKHQSDIGPPETFQAYHGRGANDALSVVGALLRALIAQEVSSDALR